MTAITSAISSALLQFLWQGVAVAFLLWVMLILLRNRSPQARYAASCTALAVLVLLPAITAWTLYRQNALPTTTTAAPVAAATLSAPAAEGRLPSAPSWISSVQTWAVPVWSVGVLLFSIRLVWGCTQISRLRRRGTTPDEGLSTLLATLARRAGVSRAVRILVARDGESPSVVGWLRPVILIPSAALLGLTAEQLEAVLAHELAHIRRHDYLVNVLQSLVETLLFYHPAVWWVSARIRHERELCCDDLAVRSCGDAVCYARALTKLERLRMAPPAMALGSNSGSMLYRIQRLLGAGAAEYAPSKLPAILAMTLGLACFGLNLHWAHGQQSAAIYTFRGAGQDSPGVSVDLGGAAILHRNRVEYPGSARERGMSGTVNVELTTDANGTVSGARILSGPAEFRSAVLHSVLDWHFAQSAANAVWQVRIQFDHAKAQEPPAARDTERGFSVTTDNGMVTLRTQPLAGVSEDQAIFAKEQQREATRKTAEFLEQELKTAEAGAAAGSSEQKQRVGELEQRLRIARSVQESEEAGGMPILAGRTLANVVVTGLPDASASDLRARLGIHVGDVLTESSIEAVSQAVKQFDEHLEVNFGVDSAGKAELHIAAPRGGVYRLRLSR